MPADAAQPTSIKKAGVLGANSLQMIYEKLNMNDRKVMQMKALLPLTKQQALKQENNFFPQVDS